MNMDPASPLRTSTLQVRFFLYLAFVLDCVQTNFIGFFFLFFFLYRLQKIAHQMYYPEHGQGALSAYTIQDQLKKLLRPKTDPYQQQDAAEVIYKLLVC
jgi:hypothetical protein